MATRAEVVAAARGHLGTPWVHQGRFPGLALDCAGLVILVARGLGLVAHDFDVNGYERAPDGTMLGWCDGHMQRISEIELGAVLVLATAEQPQHLGIVGDYLHGGWSLIHACNATRPPRCIETRLMFARNQQLRGIYRMPGVS
jgi:cell wall-associated NlpC family hydrolase